MNAYMKKKDTHFHFTFIYMYTIMRVIMNSITLGDIYRQQYPALVFPSMNTFSNFITFLKSQYIFTKGTKRLGFFILQR